MQLLPCKILADFAMTPAAIRLIIMFVVLVGGIIFGYLASSRFGFSEHLAKTIMNIVLYSFQWIIALIVIWEMDLSLEIIWLPVVALILLSTVTIISASLFLHLKIPQKSKITIILAGSLSNIGYTGGAFVCYAIFGLKALGLANIYAMFWAPAIYLVFFPLLKVREIKKDGTIAKFRFTHFFDPRMIVIPAALVAIILNLTNLKPPQFIFRFYIIDILIYIASALAFFAIGLRVRGYRLKRYFKLYFPLAAVKFILSPTLACLLLYLLHLAGLNLTYLSKSVIIILSAAPSAVIMVTMSNVFDLDGPLASALWVTTNGFFIAVVVPILYFIFT